MADAMGAKFKYYLVKGSYGIRHGTRDMDISFIGFFMVEEESRRQGGTFCDEFDPARDRYLMSDIFGEGLLESSKIEWLKQYGPENDRSLVLYKLDQEDNSNLWNGYYFQLGSGQRGIPDKKGPLTCFIYQVSAEVFDDLADADANTEREMSEKIKAAIDSLAARDETTNA